jgi:hypothetical protein
MTKKRRRRAKPRPTWDGVYCTDESFKLSVAVRRELSEIAGLEEDSDDARCMLERVERELSKYPSMIEAVDKGPRAAHKLAFLRPQMEAAKTLHKGLTSPGSDVWWDMYQSGFHFLDDAKELSAKLEEFLYVAEEVAAALAANESRHGPTTSARAWIIRKLCCAFDRCADLKDERKPQRLKGDFVKAALDAAKIPSPALVPRKTEKRKRFMSQCRFWKLIPGPCPQCIQARQNDGAQDRSRGVSL